MPEDDCPDDCCFTDDQIEKFSRALGIDKKLVDSALYCYALNKKLERRELLRIEKHNLLEASFSILKSFLTCPRNPDVADSCAEPRVILAGASPRSSTCLLNGTSTHPPGLTIKGGIVTLHVD